MGSPVIPPPPPGFKMDAVPPPPPGFKLDTGEQSTPAATPKPGLMQQAQQFTQEHPYVTAAASLIPGIGGLIGGLTDPTGEVGKGMLKQVGRDAYGVTEGAGPLGMLAHGIAERTGLGDKIRVHTEPSNPAQTVGGYATQGAEMALPLPKAANILPSAERAGQGFERVMQVAGHHPVDLTKASVPALRAQELQQAGASMPAVVSRTLEKIPQHNPMPTTFREARDLSSNAGRLSAQDAQNMNPQMKGQVNALAKALADANMETAEKAGVGPEFKAAMKEYRQAMKLNDFKGNAAKYAKKIAGTAILGATGYEAAKHLIP